MAIDSKLVRVQEKGQITLPAELRRKLGLKKGDLVAIEETQEGLLITSQEVIAMKVLNRVGEALRQRGLSLEELIESGRDVRSQIIEEQHDTSSDDHAT